MQIYARLLRDHSAQRRLCGRVLQSMRAPSSRRVLLQQLGAELEAHGRAERATLYRELQSCPRAHGFIALHETVHREALMLVGELIENGTGRPNWIRVLWRLQTKLRRHVEREEGEVFALARQVIGDGRARDLTREFERHKAVQLARALAI